jgi:hypothetical protein
MTAPAEPLPELLATLDELVVLLRKHGELHWSAWLAADLKRLRAGDMEALENLRLAYGGMGSFSDLILSPANGHRIEKKEVESVNARLQKLASAAWELARVMRRGR